MIRNCEEIGLFDDLKHVNPFEETFRQAVDNKSEACHDLLNRPNALNMVKNNDEDTLHTPNIVPYNYTNNNDKDSVNLESEKRTVNDSETEELSSPIKPVLVSAKEAIVTKIIVDSNIKTKTNSIVKDKRAETGIVNEYKKLNGVINVNSTPKVLRKIRPKTIKLDNTLNNIKQRIRQSVLKYQSSHDNKCNAKSKMPIVNIYCPLSDQSNNKEKQSGVGIKKPINRKKDIDFKDDSANERNREAAKRYRNKQKILYDTILQRNAQLEMENRVLKQELQAFKRAHENCPVTQSLNST